MNAIFTCYAHRTSVMKHGSFLLLLLLASPPLTNCAEREKPAKRVHFFENPKPFAVPQQAKQVYSGTNFDDDKRRDEKLAAIQTWIEFNWSFEPRELLEKMIQPNQTRRDRNLAIQKGMAVLFQNYPEKYEIFLNFCVEYCVKNQLLDKEALHKTSTQQHFALNEIDFFTKQKPFEDIVKDFLEIHGKNFEPAQEDVIWQAELPARPLAPTSLSPNPASQPVDQSPALPETPLARPLKNRTNNPTLQEQLAAELISALLSFVWG